MKSNFLYLILLVYISLVPAKCAAEPVSDSRPSVTFVGINEDPLWNYKPEELTTFSRMLKASGASAIRMPIRWRVIEPQKSERQFAAIDRALDFIPEDVEVLGTLMSVPQWANEVDPDTAEGWADSYPPKDHAGWEQYVFDTVTRFKRRIHYWEIWNEQNGVDFYRPLPDAEGYTALLKTAYLAAKRADPHCTVVMGGLQMNGIIPNPWSPVKTPDFLQALYESGARPYFDVCNIHPYVLPEEGAAHMMALTSDTLAVMGRNGDSHKPVWITEVGCRAKSPQAEREQAELLATTYEMAKQEPRIQRVFWFLLRDMEKDLLGPEASMGLFSHSGRAKPAVNEFRKAAARHRTPGMSTREPAGNGASEN